MYKQQDKMDLSCPKELPPSFRLAADSSAKTLHARRTHDDAFGVLEDKTQPGILYLAKLPVLQIERERLCQQNKS